MALGSVNARAGGSAAVAFLARSWRLLVKVPDRLRERDFWIIQGAVALVTATHFLAEAALAARPYLGLHHIPVILYILPIAYASIRYSWEGGLLTSGWVALLVVPSMVLWHLEDFMWLGELSRVVVIVAVGVTLASRVEAEARQRRQAEAVSARLAVSEARFRSLFEVAGDAILVCDRRGAVVTANEAAAGFFGAVGPSALLGRPIGSLVPAWRSGPGPLAQGSNGAKGPARVAVRRVDGRELAAEAVVTPLPGNEDGGFQAVLRDATAQETRERGLQSLIHQITQAQEEERERIARELHDDTLQALVLLSRELEGAADDAGAPEHLRARLRKMAGLSSSTVEGLRRFGRDLRPSVLNDLGLVPAIEWLTADLSQRTGLEATFHIEGVVRRLSGAVELALFRIAQEALRNVEKHARATRAGITLAFELTQVRLSVTDDGAGFRAPATLEELVLAGKLGLVGLKERAAREGGTLEVHSALGRGTEVTAAISG